MGSLGRRLRSLEGRMTVPEEERQLWALREFLSRLTHEELEGLTEPGYQAAALVPCPRFEPRECGCACPERTHRGLEANLELEEEHRRRWTALYERREEILAREPQGPEDWPTAWRRRHGIRARASPAEDAHETEESN